MLNNHGGGKPMQGKPQYNNRDGKPVRNKPQNFPAQKFAQQLPEGYLAAGYYSDPEKKKLRKEYLSDYAKQLAESFGIEGGANKNKSTQIRKYFDYCVRVRQKLDRFHNDFSYIEADFASLEAKVKYAESRSVVSGIFVKFLNKNIGAVKDGKDYVAFMKHFEATIAFMKKG